MLAGTAFAMGASSSINAASACDEGASTAERAATLLSV